MQTIPALSRFFRSANLTSFRRSFEIENFLNPLAGYFCQLSSPFSFVCSSLSLFLSSFFFLFLPPPLSPRFLPRFPVPFAIDTDTNERAPHVSTASLHRRNGQRSSETKAKGTTRGRERRASQGKGSGETFIGSDLAPPNVYSFASQIFICFHPLGKLGRYVAIGLASYLRQSTGSLRIPSYAVIDPSRYRLLLCSLCTRY